MQVAGDEFFLNTNAIIESHRIRCWDGLTANCRTSTVEEVVKECATGNRKAPGYVEVIPESFETKYVVYAVSQAEVLDLRLALQGNVMLDPGEEHLLAKARTRENKWKICSPDSALVRGCHTLGFMDRVVSLEWLLRSIGVRPKRPIVGQYTQEWLSRKRTQIELDSL